MSGAEILIAIIGGLGIPSVIGAILWDGFRTRIQVGVLQSQVTDLRVWAGKHDEKHERLTSRR